MSEPRQWLRRVTLVGGLALATGCMGEARFKDRALDLSCKMEAACAPPDADLSCTRPSWSGVAVPQCYRYDAGEAARCIERYEELLARAQGGDPSACIASQNFLCFGVYKHKPSCNSDV